MSQWFPVKPDQRSEGYLLMGSFWLTAVISSAYLIIVWIWLQLVPKKPAKSTASNGFLIKTSAQETKFDLVKYLMIIYNISMVAYSGYIVIELLFIIYLGEYGLGCVTLNTGSKEVTQRLFSVGYLFYISKFIELLDTLFFLVRGKFDQVTFLHVFHHAAMPPSIWGAIRYAPGGIVFMFPLANSFVHFIMYTYYGLAAIGAHRFLWWKKYLTALQIVQFCILILHQSQVFIFNQDCDYPKIFPALICFYSAIFILLFGNFYVQAYSKRQRLSKAYITESIIEPDANGKSMVNGSVVHGFSKTIPTKSKLN